MEKVNTRLITLGAILIVLTGIIIIKGSLSSYIAKNSSLAFPALKKNETSEIDIRNEKKEINIYKKNNRWFLKTDGQEFAADDDRINRIVDAFASLKKGEIISSNKNKQEELGIGKQKITLKTKNKSYIIYIGDNYTADKNYVKVDDESEVFTTAGFSDLIYPDDYRDLSTHLISNEENICHIEINFADKNTVLDKKNNDWYSGEKKVIKERVDFFLNDLKTLKANDILTTNLENQLIYPSLTIKIKEGNQDKTAEFFEKDKDNYFLKISNSPLIFQVSAPYVASLKKEEKDFSE